MISVHQEDCSTHEVHRHNVVFNKLIIYYTYIIQLCIKGAFHFSFCLLLLHFNGHFPGKTGLASFLCFLPPFFRREPLRNKCHGFLHTRCPSCHPTMSKQYTSKTKLCDIVIRRTMTVLELPPSESCSSLVNLEFRYGIC